jgi:predicted dehydrogenase
MRVGFLGAGLIATFHSKMIRRSGLDRDGTIVRAGVYDPDTERLQAFASASGHVACASEDEVLDGCDAVYVCTWTSEHPRLVRAAAARGLAVFCEKPLATTLSDAEAMAVDLAAAAVTNQVGLILRRSPAYLWARHLIADERAGRVMGVVFRDDQFIPVQGHYASTWRGDVARAGAGTLLEHSIHDVDMLHSLVGPVTAVSARRANFHAIEGIEDVVSLSLEFAGGAVGTLSSIWHDNLARPSLRRVEVFCERRYVHLDGDDWFGPVSWTDSDGADGTLEGDALVAAAADLIEGPLNPDEAFLRAALDHRAAWPDAEVAVAAHRVVDAAYRSADARGAAVEIDPVLPASSAV